MQHLQKLCFIFCLLLLSCERFDFIDLTNECNTEIVCDYNYDTIPVLNSKLSKEFYLSNSIKKGETQRLSQFGENGWSEYIEGGTNNKLSIFIFETDSLRKYGSIDSLVKRKLYNRKDFSISDIRRNENKLSICK